MDLQVSPGDDGDFADAQTIATIGNTQILNWKLIETNLIDGGSQDRRLEEVRYARLRFNAVSGTFGAPIPRIGQLVLGQRRTRPMPERDDVAFQRAINLFRHSSWFRCRD